MSLLAPALLASKVWKLGVGWATWVRCFPLSLSYARVRVGIQFVRVSPLRPMQEKVRVSPFSPMQIKSVPVRSVRCKSVRHFGDKLDAHEAYLVLVAAQLLDGGLQVVGIGVGEVVVDFVDAVLVHHFI